MKGFNYDSFKRNHEKKADEAKRDFAKVLMDNASRVREEYNSYKVHVKNFITLLGGQPPEMGRTDISKDTLVCGRLLNIINEFQKDLIAIQEGKERKIHCEKSEHTAGLYLTRAKFLETMELMRELADNNENAMQEIGKAFTGTYPPIDDFYGDVETVVAMTVFFVMTEDWEESYVDADWFTCDIDYGRGRMNTGKNGGEPKPYEIEVPPDESAGETYTKVFPIDSADAMYGFLYEICGKETK